MQATNLNTEKAKAIVILVAGLVAVVVILVFISKTFGGISNFLKGITNALGITDDPATAANKTAVANAKQQAASVNSAWSPQYYKNAPDGAALMTQASADSLASQIWNSTGIFSTDIEQVYGAIKQLSAKSQVSFLADRFNALYNQDLLSWITLQYTKMGVPDPVLSQILDYVNGLSNY